MSNNIFKAYISNDNIFGQFWNTSNDALRARLQAYWVMKIPGELTPVLQHGRWRSAYAQAIYEDYTMNHPWEVEAHIAAGDYDHLSTQFELSDVTEPAGLLVDSPMSLAGDFKHSVVEVATSQFYEIEEEFYLTPKAVDTTTISELEIIVDRIDGKTFMDCTTFTTVPVKYPELHSLATAFTINSLTTDFSYNFLRPNYETYVNEIIKDRSIWSEASPENYLPNLYGYYIAQTTGELQPYNTCEGSTCFVGENITNFMDSDDLGLFLTDGGSSADESTNLTERFTNVVFSMDNSSVVTNAPSMAPRFPLYNKFSWSSYESSQFVKAIADAALDDDLMKYVVRSNDPDLSIYSSYALNKDGTLHSHMISKEDLVNGTTSGMGVGSYSHTHDIINGSIAMAKSDPGDITTDHTHHFIGGQPKGYQIVETVEVTGTNADGNLEVTLEGNNFYADVPSFDIMAWWNEMRNMSGVIGKKNLVSDYTNFVVMDDRGITFSNTGGSITKDSHIFTLGSTFENLLKTLAFYGKLKGLIKDNMISWADLVMGKTCHNETIFYRISKRTDPNGHVVQNVWFPNFPDLSVVEYLDTQVGYDIKYYYDVTAYKLIVGASYRYVASMVPDASGVDSMAHVVVTTTPTLKLIECPYVDFDGTILDSPPVAPNVDIIPFKGVNNKLLINLNTSTGEYELTPIIIQAGDMELIAKIRETQKLSPTAPIIYKTDDRVSAFQVFRVTSPPRGYSDFATKLLTTVSTTLNTDTYTSAASFQDLITSNTVYYYIFRAVDFHGYISNPTSVYKVELVEEDGAIYPLIEIMEDFKSPDTHQLSRSFQKLISIVPTYTQSIVDTSNLIDSAGITLTTLTGSADKIQLGIEEENLFGSPAGQNFKIRLISKQTGRKIDFNLTFKINHLLG